MPQLSQQDIKVISLMNASAAGEKLKRENREGPRGSYKILSNLSPHFESICFVVRQGLVNQVIIKSRQGCVTSCQLSQEDPRHFGMIGF